MFTDILLVLLVGGMTMVGLAVLLKNWRWKSRAKYPGAPGKPYCCYMDCPDDAEFSIHGSPGHFEDVTEACEKHVGSLLGTPTWLKEENTHWLVYPLEVTHQGGRAGRSKDREASGWHLHIHRSGNMTDQNEYPTDEQLEETTLRTEAEDKEKHEVEFYGADAKDWLARWDEGRTVWSIEMGGLGPGYEQCIHITCAEILRVMLDRQIDVTNWEEKEAWSKDRDEIETLVMALPKIKGIGLSGAQWGGAMNLAAMFYRHGPRHVMTDERVKDRHIQVQRTFPVAA